MSFLGKFYDRTAHGGRKPVAFRNIVLRSAFALVVFAVLWPVAHYAALDLAGVNAFGIGLRIEEFAILALFVGGILHFTPLRSIGSRFFVVAGMTAVSLIAASTTRRTPVNPALILCAEIGLPALCAWGVGIVALRVSTHRIARLGFVAAMTSMCALLAGGAIVRGYLEMGGVIDSSSRAHYSGVHTPHTMYDLAIVVGATVSIFLLSARSAEEDKS